MRWVILVCVPLSACSGSISFGPSPGPPPLVIPPHERVVETPNGTVVATPDDPPIETVITGLSQAAQVRSLVRQLNR